MRIKNLIISFCLLVLLLFLPCLSVAGIEDCKKFSDKVRKAHEWFFGIDYPYWYSVAQLKVESNCRWRTSLDGWGSLGYAQITPRWWDKELSKLFPSWKEKDSFDYFLAQAYILHKYHKINKCGKLFITYQCYNRSCWKVLKETKGCCSWEQGYQECLKKPKKICVWRVKGKCKQYRTDCDINYLYSKKIYKYGKPLEEWKTEKYKFW